MIEVPCPLGCPTIIHIRERDHWWSQTVRERIRGHLYAIHSGLTARERSLLADRAAAEAST